MLATLAATTILMTTPAPEIEPLYPIPSSRQLAWHKLKTYAFIHFGPNTFTAKEWGDGLEDPKIFAPTQLDTDQWCKTFADAGLTAVIITAKHHDGFCLWPTKYSEHSVKNATYNKDILAQLSKSAKKYNLKFGVYVSPWDRNHPTYGTPEYNDVFVNMLEEVLTQYGDVFEVWFDGANGEGPNGKRQVYDWPRFHATVRKHQPNAVMFSDAGPDIRWVGNEAGHSHPTCWATLNRDYFFPGDPKYKQLTQGHQGGSHWLPAECDVSIRRGWFWRDTENNTVKSPKTLLDLYLRSVGQNSNFLLNIPPDKRGLIHEQDVKSLLGFKKLVDQLYANPKHQKASASSPHTHATTHPKLSLDNNIKSYWASNRETSGTLSMSFPTPQTIDTIHLQEAYHLGQRTKQFALYADTDKGQVTLATGTTIGVDRILTFPATKVKNVTLEITDSLATPAISTFHAYHSKLNLR